MKTAPRAAGLSLPRALPRTFWPYLLVAPAVAGALYLLVYPLVRNVVISLQRYGMGELIRGEAKFVGFENYTRILGDEGFWTVVWRTLWWTTLNVVLIMGLATLVALMIQRLGKVMRIVVMSGLVLAWASPVIATTTIFQWLFASRFGVVNWLLVQLGFDSYQNYTWFANGPATFAILVVLIVWQSVPFAAITLHSALITVPGELYESARLDGASGLRMFRSITLPILRPVFGLVLSLEIIWTFTCFAQIWALSKGGPDGSTTTLPVYAYQVAQSLHRYDLAGAASTITVLILVAMLVAYARQMFKEEAEL
ncbi:carbohydrate ABC transporter permease [Streptomyces sp. NPDC004111]|uniref:carbohydrate ABC transporter permease n=1 Tax=Streptomyces sp. NPDC004111 TaxID=3364690 RepID=UPI0036C19B51